MLPVRAAPNQPVNRRIEWWGTAPSVATLESDSGARRRGDRLAQARVVQLSPGVLLPSVRPRPLEQLLVRVSLEHVLAGDSERKKSEQSMCLTPSLQSVRGHAHHESRP